MPSELEIDFLTRVSWKPTAKVTSIKDNKGKSYHAYLSDLDDEITNAYITIICHEKNPSSEMQNEIKSLASENLELDIQNIYVDYIDFESFTSNERVSNEFFDYAK